MSHHEHVERNPERHTFVVDNVTVRRLRRYSEYGVSEDGQIVRFYSERSPFPVWLTQSNHENGYKTVSMRRDDNSTKTRRVHRLVGQGWVAGRTLKRYQIDHIDDNKHNNHALNLCWVTNKENNIKRALRAQRHHTNVKNLDDDEIMFIYKNGLRWCKNHPRKTRRTAAELGAMFDVSVKSIRKIQCRIHRCVVTDRLYTIKTDAITANQKGLTNDMLRRSRGIDRRREVHLVQGDGGTAQLAAPA